MDCGNARNELIWPCLWWVRHGLVKVRRCRHGEAPKSELAGHDSLHFNYQGLPLPFYRAALPLSRRPSITKLSLPPRK
jgi:hypothetical protein